MTIIKNPFEVFLVTSKKQGNGIIGSKVGLYSIKGQFTHICQLNGSCGQDSMSGIVLWRTINLGRQISDISKKSMQATIYCHYD
jgi:hypothetical protein